MQSNSTIVIAGPSQSGKSSMLNSFKGYPCLKVGTGNGISVTTEHQFLDISHSSLLSGASIIGVDTIGLGDSELQVSDQEIMKKLAWSLKDAQINSPQIHCFLITESLANDTIGLRNTLNQVARVFGFAILKSIVVLVTKPDEINPKKLEMKLKVIQEVCAEKRLPFTVWQSMENDEIISNSSPTFIEQCSRLNQSISKTIPYQLTEINNIENKIQQRAQYLSVHGPKNKISVPKQMVRQSTENHTEYYTVMEPQQRTVKKWKGDLGKIFGIKKDEVITELVNVQKSRVVQIPKHEYYTVYEDQYVPYDFSYYQEEARKAVMNEIRAQFKTN